MALYSVVGTIDTFTRVDLENESAAFFFWMFVIILVIALIVRMTIGRDK